MNKVKLFIGLSGQDLESQMNNWFQTNPSIDLKMQSYMTHFNSFNQEVFSCIIIYVEAV